MSSESFEKIALNIDLRTVDTRHAISALRKYVGLVEQQMAVVQKTELDETIAAGDSASSQEEHDIHSTEVWYVERLFEEDLVPTMRYSFAVLLHTIFETQLSVFCRMIEKEQKLPVAVSDLRGSPIDRIRKYLNKVAKLPVTEFPQWQALRRLQAVRDCIVHSYGYLEKDNPDHKKIRAFASSDNAIAVNSWQRIDLSASFAEQQLSNIEALFTELFRIVGWKD